MSNCFMFSLLMSWYDIGIYTSRYVKKWTACFMFMDFCDLACYNCTKTYAIAGAGFTYPSGAHELAPFRFSGIRLAQY